MNKIFIILKRVLNKVNEKLRFIYNKKNQRKLKNKDFSILCNNCVGGFISHDLGLKFNSPFVNLWIYPKDFIKFVNNIEFYQKCELKFISEKDVNYPVALLDDIKIFFMHYENEEQAKQKWKERSKRINFNNLFIILVERDGCTYEDLKAFDKIKYKNKVCFTHKKYDDIKSSFYIKGFENDGEVGALYEYKKAITPKRYYDEYDYIKWFNGNTNSDDDTL